MIRSQGVEVNVRGHFGPVHEFHTYQGERQ